MLCGYYVPRPDGLEASTPQDGTIIEESDNRGKKESDIQTFVQNLAAAPNTHVASRAAAKPRRLCDLPRSVPADA